MIPWYPSSSPTSSRPIVVVVFALTTRTDTEEESTSMLNIKVHMDLHVEGGMLPLQES